MRRVSLFTLSFLVLISLTAASWAQSSGAHFQRNSVTASVDSNTGALTVSFTEAGLGNLDVNYTLAATGTAVYACLNGGGNHPKAANKETVSSQLSGGASFTPQNGKVIGAITLSAPSAGTFSCPSGQTLVLASVSYTNVSGQITITNGSGRVVPISNTKLCILKPGGDPTVPYTSSLFANNWTCETITFATEQCDIKTKGSDPCRFIGGSCVVFP